METLVLGMVMVMMEDVLGMVEWGGSLSQSWCVLIVDQFLVVFSLKYDTVSELHFD